MAADALKAPRIHNQIIPDYTNMEPTGQVAHRTIQGFSEEQAELLRAKKHTIEWLFREAVDRGSLVLTVKPVGVCLVLCDALQMASGSRRVILGRSTLEELFLSRSYLA